MPQVRKPSALKLIDGSRKPDPPGSVSIHLPNLDEVPDPPDWLPSTHARDEWKKLAPLLHRNGLLSESAALSLAHLCAISGKIVQLWNAGETPKGTMLTQMRNLRNDLGLTNLESDKAAISGDQSAPKNPFTELGRPGKK